MKEFSTREFVSNACCEKCGRPFEEQAEKDGLKITTTTLWHSGKNIKLTLRQTEIMQELIKVYPNILSRPRLFGRVWGNNSNTDDQILDVFICHMRKKLNRIGLGIENTWGVGFKLIKL